MIYPISFSIPEEKLCCISEIKKTKIMSSLIPGVISTYIYDNEVDYYNEYRQSYFATTQKKAGWDCMRHYEILANGCVPFFINIENCPVNTMYLCPKTLFITANKLYEKFSQYEINNLPEELIAEYTQLRDKLYNFTKDHLTTKKIAHYILDKSSSVNVNNILFLSGNTYPDYLRCLTLHGFKTIFQYKCYDYPKIPHIYKSNNIEYSKLYGKGITYTNLLDDYFYDGTHTDIINNIKNKKYDLIIYGSYHRGMPFYDIIMDHYDPSKVILLCGEDIHKCSYNLLSNRGHFVFVREL